jgi:hypothetical protein
LAKFDGLEVSYLVDGQGSGIHLIWTIS